MEDARVTRCIIDFASVMTFCQLLYITVHEHNHKVNELLLDYK
jgi:hypothetical protein